MSDKMFVTGRISSLDELKKSNNGSHWLRFNLAYSSRVKKGDEWENSQAVYIPCVAFGKIAESISETLKTGVAVCVSGNLNVESGYTNNDGVKVPARIGLIVSRIGLDVTYGDAEILRVTEKQGVSKKKQQSQSAKKSSVNNNSDVEHNPYNFDDDSTGFEEENIGDIWGE